MYHHQICDTIHSDRELAHLANRGRNAKRTRGFNDVFFICIPMIINNISNRIHGSSYKTVYQSEPFTNKNQYYLNSSIKCTERNLIMANENKWNCFVKH